MELASMRSALQSDRPPLELRGFEQSYRRMRIAVNLLIPPSAIALAGRLGGSSLIAPMLVLISLLILLHAATFRNATLATNVTVDTLGYVALGYVIDMPEVCLLIAITQALTIFLHVRPKSAVKLLGLYCAIGLVAALATLTHASPERSPAAEAFIFSMIAMATAFPAAWMLSQTAAEMLRQRDRQEALASEKDQLLEEKDRFVASVSHELRTPLTAVVGMAHMLVDQSDFSEKERQDFMETIVTQSEEVAAIVEDLLVAARAGTGHLQLIVGEVDLHAELATVLPDDFGLEVDDGPLLAAGDPIRIRQILRNLVSNAGRYGGQLRKVVMAARGPMAVVQVRDNGDPIPPDRVDTIFNAYGRAHDRPGRTDSVGLGLTVSRQLARMMGGDVTYRRQDGWTTFELTIPLAVAASVDSSGMSSAAAAAQF